MAGEDNTKKQDAPASTGTTTSAGEDAKTNKPSGNGILQWVIVAVVVVVCGGAGFGFGRLFAGFKTGKAAETSGENKPVAEKTHKTEGSAKNPEGNWYYDLEPVVGFLNEPGATRYIRAALTLKIAPSLDKEKGTALLEEKKRVLTDWLSIYLASLTIEDIRGDKNQRRIQAQLLDAFNEKLFPDAKPQIEGILFKEFVPQ